MPTQKKPNITILCVEDDRADARTIERSFRSLGGDEKLVIVSSGDEALKFLNRLPPFETAEEPALVLLDLGLPDMDGHNLLRRIRADLSLRHIPVVVLTGTSDPMVTRASYELGANAHLTKPEDAGGFVQLVSALDKFWMQLVSLPSLSEEERP